MKIYIFFLFCVLGFGAQAQKDCPGGVIEYGPTCSKPGKFDACQNGYKKMPPKKDGSVVCKCIAELEKEKLEADKRARAIQLEVDRRLKAEKAKAPYLPPATNDADLTPPEEMMKKSVDSFRPADPYAGTDLRKKSPPKKPEPTVRAGEDEKPPITPKDSVPPPDSIPKYYRLGIGPFVELGGESNKHPQFNSKFLWGATVGLTLRSQFIDGPAKGLGFAISPSYYFSMGKKFIPETTPSPYLVQEESLNGFLVSGVVDYTFWFKPLEVSAFAGYSWSPKTEIPHQGILGGLELGVENVPVKITGGVLYKEKTEFFIGLKLIKEFWF